MKNSIPSEWTNQKNQKNTWEIWGKYWPKVLAILGLVWALNSSSLWAPPNTEELLKITQKWNSILKEKIQKVTSEKAELETKITELNECTGSMQSSIQSIFPEAPKLIQGDGTIDQTAKQWYLDNLPEEMSGLKKVIAENEQIIEKLKKWEYGKIGKELAEKLIQWMVFLMAITLLFAFLLCKGLIQKVTWPIEKVLLLLEKSVLVMTKIFDACNPEEKNNWWWSLKKLAEIPRSLVKNIYTKELFEATQLKPANWYSIVYFDSVRDGEAYSITLRKDKNDTIEHFTFKKNDLAEIKNNSDKKIEINDSVGTFNGELYFIEK